MLKNLTKTNRRHISIVLVVAMILSISLCGTALAADTDSGTALLAEDVHTHDHGAAAGVFAVTPVCPTHPTISMQVAAWYNNYVVYDCGFWTCIYTVTVVIT